MDTSTFTIDIFNSPSISAGLNQVICQGDSIQLNATGVKHYNGIII